MNILEKSLKESRKRALKKKSERNSWTGPIPSKINVGIPEQILWEIPDGISRGVSRGTPEGASEEISGRIPERILDGGMNLEGILGQIPNGILGGIYGGIPEGIVTGISEKNHGGLLNRILEKLLKES